MHGAQEVSTAAAAAALGGALAAEMAVTMLRARKDRRFGADARAAGGDLKAGVSMGRGWLRCGRVGDKRLAGVA